MSDIDILNDIPQEVQSLDIELDEEIIDESSDDSSSTEEIIETEDESLDVDEWEIIDEELEDEPKKKKRHKRYDSTLDNSINESSSTREETPSVQETTTYTKSESYIEKPTIKESTPDYGNIGFVKKEDEVIETPSYEYIKTQEEVTRDSIQDYNDSFIKSHIDMSVDVETRESLAHQDMSVNIDGHEEPTSEVKTSSIETKTSKEVVSREAETSIDSKPSISQDSSSLLNKETSFINNQPYETTQGDSYREKSEEPIKVETPSTAKDTESTIKEPTSYVDTTPKSVDTPRFEESKAYAPQEDKREKTPVVEESSYKIKSEEPIRVETPSAAKDTESTIKESTSHIDTTPKSVDTPRFEESKTYVPQEGRRVETPIAGENPHKVVDSYKAKMEQPTQTLKATKDVSSNPSKGTSYVDATPKSVNIPKSEEPRTHVSQEGKKVDSPIMGKRNETHKTNEGTNSSKHVEHSESKSSTRISSHYRDIISDHLRERTSYKEPEKVVVKTTHNDSSPGYREIMNNPKVKEQMNRTIKESTQTNIPKNPIQNKGVITSPINTKTPDVLTKMEYIKKAPLYEIMQNNPSMLTDKYRQIIHQHQKEIMTNGVMIKMGDKPNVSIPNGRVILSNAPSSQNASIIINHPVVKASTEFNALKNRALREPRTIDTIIDKSKIPTSETLIPPNGTNSKTLDKEKIKDDKRNEKDVATREKAIKEIKNQMKGEISQKLQDIGRKSYEVVIRQVNDESVEGYRTVEQKTRLAREVVGIITSRAMLGNQLKQIRQINNLGSYMKINNIDMKDLNQASFKQIEKASAKGKMGEIDLKSKTKGLSKSQMVKLDRARNIQAAQGMLTSNMSKFSKEDQALLKQKNFFEYTNKNMVLKNQQLTVSLLRQNKILAHYNFDKAKMQDLRKLLKNKGIKIEDKILIKNVMENKRVLKALKRGSITGKTIKTLGSSIKEKLRDEESFQGAEQVITYAKRGKQLYKTGTVVGRGAYRVGNRIHNTKVATKVRHAAIEGEKYLGKVTLKGVKKVGDVTHINSGLKKVGNGFKKIGDSFKKLGSTKPVQGLKKVGSGVKKIGSTTKAVATAPFKGIKKASNFMSLQKTKFLNRLTNNKVFKVVAAPVKGLFSFINLGAKAKAWLMKIILGFVGGYIIIFLLLFLFSAVLIPALMTSVIFEEDNRIQEWVEHIQGLQEDFDDDIVTRITGSPEGKDVLGNTIDKYGMPETIGPNGEVSEKTVGYTIKYVDKNGNEITKSDNSKDIVSFLAVYLQQDFDLGAGYFEGMIEELFEETHPEVEYLESDIFYCDYGCEELEYNCTEMEGIPLYNTYGSRTYNQYGCDPYYTYCDGCTCPGTHTGSHTLECPNGCQDPHYYSCSGCDCDGHINARCSTTHKQKVCYGHRDVEITITVLFLQDLLDSNYYLHKDKSFIHPLYNNKLDTLKEEFNTIGGWSEDNKEWCWNIYNQDWYDLYGVSVSAYGLSIDNFLSQEQLENLVNALPEDLSEKRKDIVEYGYKCVGMIPYYWGGKTNKKGLENNNFGALTVPDASSHKRTKVGLDCSGFVNFLFNTVLDEYVGTGTANISDYCYQISKNDLKPGDLAFKVAPGSSDNHIGVFAGYNEYGDRVWIHCNGSDNNVSANNVNYWTYFYRPNCFND